MFQKLLLNKAHCWLYTDKDLHIYAKLFLKKLDIVNLPYLDVYEINAECLDGATVGYLFDTQLKRVKSSFNYIAITPLAKDEFSLSQMKAADTALELRFKIKELNLYSLGVRGSLVTSGYNKNLKESLEF